MDTDTTAIIDAAKAEGTFDVLAFIEDTAYPTDSVTVFKDAKSADDYVKLVNKRNELELNKENKAEVEKLTEQIEAVAKKLGESAIVFELQGMPPGVVSEIYDVPKGTEDTEEASRGRDNNLIAASILSASNHTGVKDTRTWSGDDVEKLRRFLKESEFAKLITSVGRVNFNAAVFDAAVDAGFSGGSTNVA